MVRGACLRNTCTRPDYLTLECSVLGNYFMSLTRRTLLQIVACAWWRGESIRFDNGRWWHVKPDGNGYAPKALDLARWQRIDGSMTEAVYPAQMWTFSGGVGYVYGYFVTDAEGRLAHAERFLDAKAPFLCANPGDRVTVVARFALGPRGS